MTTGSSGSPRLRLNREPAREVELPPHALNIAKTSTQKEILIPIGSVRNEDGLETEPLALDLLLAVAIMPFGRDTASSSQRPSAWSFHATSRQSETPVLDRVVVDVLNEAQLVLNWDELEPEDRERDARLDVWITLAEVEIQEGEEIPLSISFSNRARHAASIEPETSTPT